MKFTARQSASILLGATMVLSAFAWIAGPDLPAPATTASLLASASPSAIAQARQDGGNVVAGLGVVEPSSGIINLSALMPGVIARISKNEGDAVKAGEVLAELANDDLKARVAQAESAVRLEAARLALVENGPREQEIAQAQAKVREEMGSVKLYDAQARRYRELANQGAIARETFNESQRQLTVSQQRLDAARQQLDMLQNGSRPEDVEAGRASLKLAEDRLAEARSILDKSYVRSTIDGFVLRRFREPGEAVLAQPNEVILQIADTSRLVVRTQIDENDISGLKLGQKAEISAPAFKGKTLSGTVSNISLRLGAKTVNAETPAEKRDTRVLDVLVALEPNVALPVNLRVDVVIDLDSATRTAANATQGFADLPLRLATLDDDHCAAPDCNASAGVLDTILTSAIRP